jgi:hypothetical protein
VQHCSAASHYSTVSVTCLHEVVDVIEPLNVNGVALLDGSFWLAHPALDVTQRFDLES